MGFDFLPEEHNGTSERSTTGHVPPGALQSNAQDGLLDAGTACKTSNALASSSRLPEASNVDIVQRPYILDQLYSWEDLVSGSSNSRVSLRFFTGLDTVH
jgi:hypothetical protein